MKIEFANELGIQLSRKDKNKPAKLNGAIGGPIGGMITRKAVEDFGKLIEVTDEKILQSGLQYFYAYPSNQF